MICASRPELAADNDDSRQQHNYAIAEKILIKSKFRAEGVMVQMFFSPAIKFTMAGVWKMSTMRMP